MTEVTLFSSKKVIDVVEVGKALITKLALDVGYVACSVIANVLILYTQANVNVWNLRAVRYEGADVV